MKVLIWIREPGDTYWYHVHEGQVIASTEHAYKVRIGWFDIRWFNKRGDFCRCETITEVEKWLEK